MIMHFFNLFRAVVTFLQCHFGKVIGSLRYLCFRCWSLKFKQSDHQFLHQSNVFHHINNILSKSDDGDSEESFNISVQSGYEAISQARARYSYYTYLFFLNPVVSLAACPLCCCFFIKFDECKNTKILQN